MKSSASNSTSSPPPPPILVRRLSANALGDLGELAAHDAPQLASCRRGSPRSPWPRARFSFSSSRITLDLERAPACRASARGSRRSGSSSSLKRFDQLLRGVGLAVRLADDLDHLVERVEDLREALEDVDALLQLAPARTRSGGATVSSAEVEEVRAASPRRSSAQRRPRSPGSPSAPGRSG